MSWTPVNRPKHGMHPSSDVSWDPASRPKLTPARSAGFVSGKVIHSDELQGGQVRTHEHRSGPQGEHANTYRLWIKTPHRTLEIARITSADTMTAHQAVSALKGAYDRFTQPSEADSRVAEASRSGMNSILDDANMEAPEEPDHLEAGLLFAQGHRVMAAHSQRDGRYHDQFSQNPDGSWQKMLTLTPQNGEQASSFLVSRFGR